MEAEKSKYELVFLHVVSGTDQIPTATVKLRVDDKNHEAVGIGNGPVHAIFRAIRKITKKRIKLVRYSVISMRGGANAKGEIECLFSKNGNIIIGRARGTDINVASAQAYVDGLNQFERGN